MKTSFKKITAVVCCVLMLTGMLTLCGHADGQYAYPQTPAQSVRACVTLSNDGIPVRGNDDAHTVLAGLDVTVPYFDLDLYGLSAFYRRGADGHIVERPTALHLYIYLLERFYLGLDEAVCGKGVSGLMEYDTQTAVQYLDGEEAYTSGGRAAFSVSGTSAALHLTAFWGHDENLMYFHNHAYPLMSENLGATCDYILLSDGDSMDIALFSDRTFWNNGAFLSFGQDSYSAQPQNTFAVSLWQCDTHPAADGTQAAVPAAGLAVDLYDARWQKVGEIADTDNIRMDKPGTYYLLAHRPHSEAQQTPYAPGVAKVSVGAQVTLSLDRERIFAGDAVTVTVALDSPLCDVVSFDWQLRLDGALFVLTDSTVGISRPDVCVSNRKSDAAGTYYSVSFVDKSAQGAVMQAGTVCTLTFTAQKDIAADTTAAFSLVSEGVYDADFAEIPAVAGEAVSVCVQRVLPSGLRLERLPNRLSYRYKEALNTDGMEVYLLYNNGEKERVTEGYTCTPDVFAVEKGLPLFGLRGEVPVTVSYFGFEQTFSVQVHLSAWQWFVKIVLFGWLWY